MRRYRTVILVFFFGIVPMVVALVLGVTVLLPSLQQTDEVEEPDVAVQEAPPPEPVMVRVALTAARTLSPGMLLTDGDLALTEVANTQVPLPARQYVYLGEIEEDADGVPPEQLDRLHGYAVRSAVTAGEPVVWATVVSPGDSQFLATVLEPGRVAVSIPVSQANRQARLVAPGNRVDVVLATDLSGALVVRTIMEDVRVLAVNSQIIAGEDVRTGERGEAGDAEANAGPVEVVTVTLEVTPIQGEQLALGTYQGQLSLAIRPDHGAPRRPDGPVQDMRSVLRLAEPEPQPLPEPELLLPDPGPREIARLQNLQVGEFDTLALPVATGGISPHTYALTCAGGSLPPGMGFEPTIRVLAGTPTSAFRDTCAYTVTDSSQPVATGSRTFEVTVEGPGDLDFQPELLLPDPGPREIARLQNLQVGEFDTLALPVATGGISPHTYALTCAGGSLPPGMGFEPTIRVLAGTPTAAFRDTCAYTVMDSSQPAATGSRTFDVTVEGPGDLDFQPELLLPDPGPREIARLQNLQVGEFDTLALPVATGGISPHAYALTCAGGSLPPGMGFEPTIRVLAGTPTSAFRDTCAYTVTDSSQPVATGSRTFEVTVEGPGDLDFQPELLLPDPGPREIARLQNLQVGEFDTLALPVATGGISPHTYALTCAGGSLPPGMGFEPTIRVLAGTPTAAFRDTCAYTVMDSSQPAATGSRTFDVTVEGPGDLDFQPGDLDFQPELLLPDPGPREIARLQNLQVGEFDTLALPVATGGISPHAYALTCAGGSLPPGMGFEPTIRVLAGTPTTAFRDTCAYTVTDSSQPAATGSRTFEVTVEGPGDLLPLAEEPVLIRVIRGTSEETVVFGGPGPAGHDGRQPGLANGGMTGDMDTSENLVDVERMMRSLEEP